MSLGRITCALLLALSTAASAQDDTNWNWYEPNFGPPLPRSAHRDDPFAIMLGVASIGVSAANLKPVALGSRAMGAIGAVTGVVSIVAGVSWHSTGTARPGLATMAIGLGAVSTAIGAYRMVTRTGTGAVGLPAAPPREMSYAARPDCVCDRVGQRGWDDVYTYGFRVARASSNPGALR